MPPAKKQPNGCSRRRRAARLCIALAAALCALLPLHAAAEVVLEKRMDNGPDSDRFVLVVLAEGYTAAQQELFNRDVDNLIEALCAATPWKEYRRAINVYSLFAASLQSGADHPADGVYVDTAYDAMFDTYGIARLLTVHEAKALDAAAAVPEYDAVIVLVNDPQYGGSGGSVIVASTHAAAAEIVLHEAGHVIGRLADEYTSAYPGYPPGDSEPNVTFQTQRDKIKWKDWIAPDTPLPTAEAYRDVVGLFEGARYLSSGIYRPQYGCRMRSLNQPYCPICAEALILNIYGFVGLIEAYYPAETDLVLRSGEQVVLGVEPLALDSGHPYTFAWDVDGVMLEDETHDKMTVFPSRLGSGTHKITVTIRDATDLVKNDGDNHLETRRTWTITKPFCSGSLAGSLIDGRTGRPLSTVPVSIVPAGIVVQADDGGGFVCDDLPCGVYALRIAEPGYAPVSHEVAITDGRRKTVAVVLQPAADAFYVSGSVLNCPAGCTITLSGIRTLAVAADREGRFSIGPVPPGDYIITASAADHVFFPPAHKISITTQPIPAVRFVALKRPQPAKNR